MAKGDEKLGYIHKMVEALISGDSDEAADQLHAYLQLKTRDILLGEKKDDDDDEKEDKDDDDDDDDDEKEGKGKKGDKKAKKGEKPDFLDKDDDDNEEDDRVRAMEDE